MVSFEIKGIEGFIDCLKAVQDVYPKEIKKFMQKEENKLKKATETEAQASVDRLTGNYFKGIT